MPHRSQQRKHRDGRTRPAGKRAGRIHPAGQDCRTRGFTHIGRQAVAGNHRLSGTSGHPDEPFTAGGHEHIAAPHRIQQLHRIARTRCTIPAFGHPALPLPESHGHLARGRFRQRQIRPHCHRPATGQDKQAQTSHYRIHHQAHFQNMLQM